MSDFKYGEQNELNLKVIISLMRSRNYISKKENILFKKHGLTPSQFGVLEFLYHKGANRISVIISKMLTTGGNMTVVIDNLEKCGFVVRQQDPIDRRAQLIAITDKGEKIISEAFKEHVNNLDEILSVLDNSEKNTLISILKKVGDR